MQVSATTSATSALSAARVPENREAPGPDHDGDSDDKMAIAQQPVAATPPGMGVTVNTVA